MPLPALSELQLDGYFDFLFGEGVDARGAARPSLKHPGF
jgi:hypothetical protein